MIVSLIVKITAMAALALVAARLARGSRAAVRHAMLAAAFGVLLLMPVVSLVAPPVRVAMPIAAPAPAAPSPVVRAAAADAPALPADMPAVLPAVRPTPVSLSSLLLATWIFGSSLCLIPMFAGLWQVRKLRQSAVPWRRDRSGVEILLSDRLTGPIACGALHPAIVLPVDAQTWSEADLERAIVHELEHVRRRDWVIHCLARATCALYWFHPLVWMAQRQLALEAERACDDAVLSGSEATAYADQLVALARQMSGRKPLLAMANRADLTKRVGAVLDGRQRRGRASALLVAVTCAVALLLVLAISPLSIIAEPPPAAPMPVAAAPVADPVSPPLLTQATRPVVPQSAPANSAVPYEAPLFQAVTSLVITDVKVTDQNGKTIEGLGTNDFVVTEDGRLQRVVICEFQQLMAQEGIATADLSYYVLAYYSTNSKNDGAYRRVQVALKENNGARLDFRAGYYAPPPPPESAVSAVPAEALPAGVTAPAVLVRVDPEYSEEARKAKYSGSVLLSAGVDASGHVSEIRVVRPLGMGLSEKAVAALQRWRFIPARKDGAPVSVRVLVRIDFRLL